MRMLLLGQLVADRGEGLGVARDHRQQPRPDRVECLRGAQAVGRRARVACRDLLLQAGDADLEELVEVAGEDGQEAHALEQRVALVDGLVQHAVVELEPRQLAVDVRDLRSGCRATRSGGTRLARSGGSRRDQLITRRTDGGHGVSQSTNVRCTPNTVVPGCTDRLLPVSTLHLTELALEALAEVTHAAGA